MADYQMGGYIEGETDDEYRRRMAALQGQTVPSAPVAPTNTSALTANMYTNNNVATQPEPQPSVDQQFVTEFTSAGQDPLKLLTLGRDTRFAPELQQRATQEAQNIMARQVQQRRTEEQVRGEYQRAMETGNFSPLAKMLRSQGEEGSFAKMILLGFVSPELAGREADKLGLRDQTVVSEVNGEPYILKMRAGVPVQGYSGRTGQALDAQQLVTAAAGAVAQKGAATHTGKMQDITTNEIYYEKTTPQGIQLVDHTGKRYTGPSSNLRAYGIGSDIATKNQIQLNELQNRLAYAPATKRAEVVAENEARHGPLDPLVKQRALEGQPLAGVVGTVTNPAPVQAAPAAAPAPTPVQAAPAPVQTSQAPAQVPRVPVAPAAPAATQVVPTAPAAPGGGTVTGGGNTIAGRETAEALRKRAGEAEIEKKKELEVAAKKPAAEEAGKQVAVSQDTQNLLNSIDKVVTTIDSGKHNLGHPAGGLIRQGELTGETVQKIGSALRTEDAKNTKLIMDTIQKLAADGLKVLGANPSTRDLEFWTKYKPDINSDPAFVRDWITSRSADLKRRLQYAQTQSTASGGAPAAGPVNPAPRGTPENPINLD